MNPFSTINGIFQNQHVTPRANRRPLGKRLALEALEGRAMMAADAQLDAASEAVELLNNTSAPHYASNEPVFLCDFDKVVCPRGVSPPETNADFNCQVAPLPEWWTDHPPILVVDPAYEPVSDPPVSDPPVSDPPVSDPPVSDPSVSDLPAPNPIAEAYASPDVWQKVWGDTDSGTNGSPSDVPQTSPRDEVADAPVIADPVADTREDGWQDEVFAEEQSDTTEPADDTLAEAVVDEFGDADFIPSYDSDYEEEV
jgi:hypothetical protein